MASLPRPHLGGSKRKLTVIFVALTTLVGLPVLLFVILAVQGFVSGVGTDQPVDVIASEITKSSAVVSWHTDKKTQGVVEYGTAPTALNSYAPEVGSSKEHEVSLTLLSQSTTYYYQIRINGTTHDNSGVPWTFTTKNKDGEDVAEAIKGVTTRIAREGEEATEEAGISTSNCTVTDCNEIKTKLGKGCSSADYFKCISLQGTPSVNGYTVNSASTPTPTVSKTISSSNCAIKYLQVEPGKTCLSWTWDSIATKNPDCRKAFDRYVFQCSSKSFTSTNPEQIPTWYYNNAITNMTSNSVELNSKPPQGSTVYCQVRAEDANGSTTEWVGASAVCDYPPTPTP